MPIKLVNRGIRLSLLTITLAIAAALNAQVYGQEVPLPMFFGDLHIDRNFSSDHLIVRGISGGSIPAKEIARRTVTPTGHCTGYYDEQPNHTLELTSKLDYLKLLVDSPKDTTLIVSGPGGIWCNDNFDGKNPGLVGEWLSGTYNVWIGSYKKNEYFPYTLEAIEDQ